GPVWTSWTFYMECYCGFLQAHLHSRQFPWSNISCRVLYMAYLTQVTIKYDLSEGTKSDCGVRNQSLDVRSTTLLVRQYVGSHCT
ncbi:hypothetical protein BD769DRAFT_1359776, partial [Suillus cothurnatus]